jgi:hypothetical protein
MNLQHCFRQVREEATPLLLSTVGRGESLPANGEERWGINRCLQKKGAGGAAQAAHRQKEGGHGGRAPDVNHDRCRSQAVALGSGSRRQRTLGDSGFGRHRFSSVVGEGGPVAAAAGPRLPGIGDRWVSLLLQAVGGRVGGLEGSGGGARAGW